MRIHLLLLIVLIACACVRKSQSPASQSVKYPTSADFKKGENFLYFTNRPDSAFIYFNEVTKNSKDSFLIALSYGYMAEIQQEAGDFFGVQESALAGIKLLNEDSLQRDCMASLYNNLGRSNVGLKKYDAAIGYYDRAIKAQPRSDYQNVYRNNIAVALREKGDYKEALRTFLSIKASQDEDRRALARRITNLASLKWEVDRNFNPLPDLYNALSIRIREKDDIGVTASYNHLFDYYRLNNADSALYYARKMYAIAQKTNSADDRLEALRKLIPLASVQETKRLFSQYQHLSDSVQTTQNAAKNQFALIRYESDRSKAENLVLQKDNAQKELQILRQKILVYGSILMAILIVGGAFWRYRKKRQQMKLETHAAIQKNQLRISQKIHDTVANGLYRVMSEIEHAETIDKVVLLDKIEYLYEHSRDISYEPVEKEGDTPARISRTLTSFATPTTKISVVGNKEELWKGISSMIVKELEQVLQELMVNMKKHSGARHVVIHFSRPNNHLELIYKDDGQGFPSNFIKGNGLKSTGTRINQIGGQITFAKETANGAEIKILIPILSNDQESINS